MWFVFTNYSDGSWKQRLKCILDTHTDIRAHAFILDQEIDTIKHKRIKLPSRKSKNKNSQKLKSIFADQNKA